MKRRARLMPRGGIINRGRKGRGQKIFWRGGYCA